MVDTLFYYVSSRPSTKFRRTVGIRIATDVFALEDPECPGVYNIRVPTSYYVRDDKQEDGSVKWRKLKADERPYENIARLSANGLTVAKRGNNRVSTILKKWYCVTVTVSRSRTEKGYDVNYAAPDYRKICTGNFPMRFRKTEGEITVRCAPTIKRKVDVETKQAFKQKVREVRKVLRVRAKLGALKFDKGVLDHWWYGAYNPKAFLEAIMEVDENNIESFAKLTQFLSRTAGREHRENNNYIAAFEAALKSYRDAIYETIGAHSF